MKKIALTISLVLLYFTLSNAFADDLMTIYQQALTNDPTYKAALAEWLAAKEQLPISVANLLPNLSGTGSLERQRFMVEGAANTRVSAPKQKYYNSYTAYGLSLTQPLFNYSNWAAVKNASANVKQAHTKYLASGQDLILRTTTAYFNVLKAIDVLRVTRAEKKAVYSQLQNNKQRFDVGLLPITDVYEAQAQYDSVVAQEITAENDLTNSKEKLREITGIKPAILTPLGPNPPLLTPQPSNIDNWVTTAEKENLSLLQTHYATIAAKENIKIQAGGHLPIIDATGNYGYSYETNPFGGDKYSREKVGTLGLNLTFPIYQGGMVNAEVRQANELFQQASSLQEVSHRQVVSGTRQAYLGVIDAISKVRADRQSIISNASAYNSMLAAYKYGTRTITDVLTAQTNLYQAEKTYAEDQYNYIIQTINLKLSSGQLSENDIQGINTWLQNPIAQKSKQELKPADIYKNKTTSTKTKPQATAVSKKENPIKTAKPVAKTNTNYYVIQLAAAENKADAEYFIKKHLTQVNATYFAETKDGKALYKVVTGNYATYAEANAAKTKLVEILHNDKIWIRKI